MIVGLAVALLLLVAAVVMYLRLLAEKDTLAMLSTAGEIGLVSLIGMWARWQCWQRNLG